MRRNICNIPRRPFSTAGYGGRGRRFNVTCVKVEEEAAKFAPKPLPDIFGVFVGTKTANFPAPQSQRQLVTTALNPLNNDERRARNAVGILFRNYATQDEKKKVAKNVGDIRKVAEAFEDQLHAFIECEPEHGKCDREFLQRALRKVIPKMTTQDDELGPGATKLGEIAQHFEEEMNALMKYEKLVRKVLEKVGIYITQGQDYHYGDPAADEEEMNYYYGDPADEEKVSKKRVENMKLSFIAYQVIEKVAKKVGNENIRKIVQEELQEELEALVINLFVATLRTAEKLQPFFMAYEVLEMSVKSCFIQNGWIKTQQEWEETVEVTMKNVGMMKKQVDVHLSAINAKQLNEELEGVVKRVQPLQRNPSKKCKVLACYTVYIYLLSQRGRYPEDCLPDVISTWNKIDCSSMSLD